MRKKPLTARYKALTPRKFPFYRLNTHTLSELLAVISLMGILRLPVSVSIMPYEPVEVLKVPSRVLTLLSFPAVRRLGKYTIHRHFLTGLKVLLPDVESLDVYHHIWFRQDYEKVAKPHEGDIVIDVGAHVGLFTLRCLKCHKVSFVVAVEPHPLNAKLLRANLALNRLKRKSTVVEAALGRREGMGELYVADAAGQHSLFYDERKHKGRPALRVRITTADKLVHELHLKRVDFMKIDVEGAELDVLMGARELLREFRPVLVIEVHTDRMPGVLRLLRAYGYSLYMLPYGVDTVHITAVPR